MTLRERITKFLCPTKVLDYNQEVIRAYVMDRNYREEIKRRQQDEYLQASQ